MVRFGAAAGILAAAAPSRSRSITLDSPVVTVGLRSSIRPTRSRRRRGLEEAISIGGSGVPAARPSTWWKQLGGSLTRPARLNPRRTSLADPAFSTCGSNPSLLSRTDPGDLLLSLEGLVTTLQMAESA